GGRGQEGHVFRAGRGLPELLPRGPIPDAHLAVKAYREDLLRPVWMTADAPHIAKVQVRTGHMSGQPEHLGPVARAPDAERSAVVIAGNKHLAVRAVGQRAGEDPA